MKLLFTFLFVACMATVSFGQIAGSKHDFSADVNMTGNSGEYCFTCHAPHNNTNDPALSSIDLLWNQTISSQTFEMYPSGLTTTINGTIDANVGGTSKLCLSCHDGVTLMGNGTAPAVMSGALTANVGIDLSNDHPIGITYEDGSGSGVTDDGLKVIADHVNVILIGGKVECASCHDAHDDVGTNLYMLRTTNVASALCLECHNK